MAGFPILSAMLLVPMLGAAACLFAGEKAARTIALAATLLDLALGVLLWANYDIGGAQWQFTERAPIFAGFSWALGIDGIALMLIVLSVFLMPICILASASIDKRVGEYMAAFLFMETLMIGVFCAQDLFLFYIFFEAGLIPMYLIIGVWGGDNRIYAAYKFFLYTLLGSVLMLIAMLWMVNEAGTTDIPTLMVYDFPVQAQTWLWLAFFASFAVKMPMWPVHTWLPDAHVQAPTAGSVILAGVLLKMASVGLPGTSNFIGEFLSLAGIYQVSSWVTFVCTTGIILGAAYMLYLYWRVAFGVQKNADAAAMPDLSLREWLMLAPLAAAVLWMGVYPESFLAPMRADIAALNARVARAAPAGDARLKVGEAKPATAEAEAHEGA